MKQINMKKKSFLKPIQRNCKIRFMQGGLVQDQKLLAYLALLIYMGIKRLPDMSYSWRDNVLYSCALWKNLMPYSEFLLLSKFFSCMWQFKS